MQPEAARKTNLFKLSWPIYIELLFVMLIGVVDTFMLSQYSDLSVAAVANGRRIISLFTVLLNVVAIGVGVVVSQYLGKGDRPEAKNAIKTGILSNAVISITLVLLIQTFAYGLLVMIQTEEVIFSDALAYLRIRAVGLVFIALTQATSHGFKSFGRTKLVMVIVGLSNILNIILNAFLIFGFAFAPELGVTGAAIASSVSKGAALLIALIFLYRKLGVHPFFLRLSPLRKHFAKIFRIGIPSASEQFFYHFAQVILLTFLNIIGPIALTTHEYIHNMMMPVLVFALAVAQGNQVIVGWHVGGRDYEGAYRRTIRTLKIAIVIVISIATFVYFQAEHILSIFTDNEEIIGLGKQAMLIVIVLEFGRLSNLVVIQALRASGDVIYPVVIAVFSMFGAGVGVAYLLGISLGYGLLGIVAGLAADECVRGALVFQRWLRRQWVGKRVAT